jgi:hypothetical protein
VRPRRYSVDEMCKTYMSEGLPFAEALRRAEVFVAEIYRYDQLCAYHEREYHMHETPRPDLFPPRD